MDTADLKKQQHQIWLKLIGSAKNPINAWTQEYVGFRKPTMPGIRAKDRLFLYAPGTDRRIFALAEAVSDPERDLDYDSSKEGSCFWKLHVHYEINLPVACGVLIEEVSSRRNLKMSVRQQSHIRLFPEESESANSKLRSAKP